MADQQINIVGVNIYQTVAIADLLVSSAIDTTAVNLYPTIDIVGWTVVG